LIAEVVAVSLGFKTVVISITASINKFLTFSRFRIEEESFKPSSAIPCLGWLGTDNGRA
jgi:hypothetical protein